MKEGIHHDYFAYTTVFIMNDQLIKVIFFSLILLFSGQQIRSIQKDDGSFGLSFETNLPVQDTQGPNNEEDEWEHPDLFIKSVAEVPAFTNGANKNNLIFNHYQHLSLEIYSPPPETIQVLSC